MMKKTLLLLALLFFSSCLLDKQHPSSAVRFFTTRLNEPIPETALLSLKDNLEVDSFFGIKLAISGDGQTLAVSAPFDSSKANHSGGIYVFSRAENSDDWYQDGPVLKATNPTENQLFSIRAMNLSGDGKTLIGMSDIDTQISIFNRTRQGWQALADVPLPGAITDFNNVRHARL